MKNEGMALWLGQALEKLWEKLNCKAASGCLVLRRAWEAGPLQRRWQVSADVERASPLSTSPCQP